MHDWFIMMKGNDNALNFWVVFGCILEGREEGNGFLGCGHIVKNMKGNGHG